MIEILNPGFYSTIQDLGRLGYRDIGVPISGCMDQHSSRLANALLGNDPNDAVIEVTLTGPTLKFTSSTAISITGARMIPKVNEKAISMSQKTIINSGDILSFGKLEFGYRSYIAVSGGFEAPMVMDSRSMYANITENNRLKTGDVLRIKEGIVPTYPSNAMIKYNRDHFQNTVLQAHQGPEFDLLSKKQQEELTTMEFTVSKNNNRMGYQLVESLKNDLAGIITAPVLPGTVQLTPSGKLILLMRDGQTSGGYPRVLQLQDEAINILAQKKANDKVSFQC